VPFVGTAFTGILISMASGGVLHLRYTGPAAYFVCLGMDGNTSIQGPNGITLMLPGQVEVRPACSSLIFRSSLGARGIAYLVPQEKLRLKAAFPGARRPTPSGQPFAIRLDAKDGSLAAKLLRDCLAGVAAQIAGGQTRLRTERAGALIAVLLREALAEKQRGWEKLENNPIPWYVAAVEQQLQNRLPDPLSVTDLARAVGVSPRTLHDGFRKHRRASPMRMLREQRMQMVRKELTEPDDTTNVTDTALKWGFNHLGRFSAYYLAQFGEKPSETLRVSRARG
jgi:AraC-like DNA-binding protein